MIVYISNHSTVETDDTIKSWIPALERYAGYVSSWWGHHPVLRFGNPPDANEWEIRCMDDSDQQGALGYHDFQPDGKPISYIFLRTDKENGYSETVTLTHELAEMIADPWISQAFQTSNTRFYAQEVGDPCEADALGQKVVGANGVSILCSDFALPGWFIPGHPGPYDWKKHVTTPLQVLPGGYAQYFEGGTWHQVGPTGAEMALEKSARFRDRTRAIFTDIQLGANAIMHGAGTPEQVKDVMEFARENATDPDVLAAASMANPTQDEIQLVAGWALTA